MKLLQATLLGATILAGTTGIASAADVYDGGYKDEPVAAYAPIAWTGFYLGAFAGLGIAETKATDIEDTDFGLGVTETLTQDGAILGATIGYNMRYDNWVFGPEIEFGYSDNDELKFVEDDSAILTEYGFYSVLGGRLGYASDRALIYAKAGLAIADINSRAGDFDGDSDTGPDGFDGGASAFGDEIRYGFAIGGGLEYAISNSVSLKAEYLYMDFGQETLNGTDGDTPFTFDDTMQTVKLGISYHLNSGH